VGRIRVLPDGLINRIAAGEVVERPASVVKELVENGLDAGARSIEVTLRGGGKAGIEVRDDGCGMEREDALLAVERHATSKLASLSDLEAIETLGFRGEALSSVASVSVFRLRTALRDGEGTEVEVRGGKIEGVREIGHPRGTSVSVERLFYNVPARRKFLRADATELSHAVRGLTRYALAHPQRRFLLRHGERRILETEATTDLFQRVSQIYGREFADKLLPFELRGAELSVFCLAGRPVDGLPRRDAQHFFVNGRAVQDRVVSHAVSQAYGNTMPHGRHPALFLFVEMDGRLVDVNVHPQKTEVRFRETSRIHDTVRGTLAETLSRAGAIPTLSDLRPPSGPPMTGVRDAALRYLENNAPETGPPHASYGSVTPSVAAATSPAPSGLLQDEQSGPRREAVPLAQFRDSYIVAQDAEGLVLVDQHAAKYSG